MFRVNIQYSFREKWNIFTDTFSLPDNENFYEFHTLNINHSFSLILLLNVHICITKRSESQVYQIPGMTPIFTFQSSILKAQCCESLTVVHYSQSYVKGTPV